MRFSHGQVILSVEDWDQYVVLPRYAVLDHGEHRLGMEGFKKLLRAALLRHQMRLMQGGYSVSLEFDRCVTLL